MNDPQDALTTLQNSHHKGNIELILNATAAESPLSSWDDAALATTSWSLTLLNQVIENEIERRGHAGIDTA